MTQRLVTIICIVSLNTALLSQNLGEPNLLDDEFRKRFTASYGILSEKEPALSDVEKAILNKLEPMLRVDREYAEELLQSLTAGETGSSASFDYLLGNLYFENGDYLLAEKQYKTAIEAFPDYQRAWTNLGVLKLRSGDTKSALIALIRAIKLGDNDPFTYGMLGYCHLQEGNFVSAGVAYDRAIVADPENLDWLEGKAQVFYNSGQFDQAIRLQDELLARRPEDVSYWMAQTNSYLAAGDYARTARNLEIVKSLDAADFQSLFLLGGIYTRLGLHEASADTYLEAAKVASGAQLDYIAKAAKQLTHTQRFSQAKGIFAKLEDQKDQLDGDALTDYFIVKSDLAKFDGELDRAIEALRQAEEHDPTNGNVLLKLAQLYADQGANEKAYYVLDRAELDDSVRYNAYLIRSNLLIAENRLRESQTYVSKALALQSSETVQALYDQLSQATSSN